MSETPELESLFDVWNEDDGKQLRRGRLIWVNLPHVMQEQTTLEAVGRNDPADHSSALFKLSTLRFDGVRQASKLPVAGLTSFAKEVYTVHRSKIRPAVLVHDPISPLSSDLRRGAYKPHTTATMVVAPLYGTAQEGRAGFPPVLLDRIMRCEYPNYVGLRVPGSTAPSVMRLDHLQPICMNHQAYRLSEHFLSDDLLALLSEWLQWLQTGGLDDESTLGKVRQMLMELD